MINDNAVLQIAKENLCLIFLQFFWETSNSTLPMSSSKSFLAVFEKSIRDVKKQSVQGNNKN